MANKEKEQDTGFAQKTTQAWQKMIESGQLSVYMAMSHEEIKKLQETDDEEIAKTSILLLIFVPLGKWVKRQINLRNQFRIGRCVPNRH